MRFLKMNSGTLVFATALMMYGASCTPSSKENPRLTKPRIIVTADPELDDSNSLIRFLMYSSDLDIEGLIYSSSQFHWKGDGNGTKWFVPNREYTRYGLKICPCESWRWAKDERFIHDVVEAYEKAYPNLKVHNAEYPAPETLKAKIFYGNIEFDGDISKDTEGSDHIRKLMLDDKPGPLFITAWGGGSTIARALKSIQDQYEQTPEWPSIKEKVSKKVVLLPSGDQDDTYANYIKPNWPDIEYRQFRGGPNYGYGAQFRASKEDSVYLTPAWMKDNISDRGPLGAIYRVWGDGKQMVKDDIFDYFGIAGHTNEELKKMGYIVWMPVQPQGSWLGEGDTGTFMNMLGNGLRAYEDASYGGWGGRGVNAPVFSFTPADPAAMDSTLEGMMSTMGAMSSGARQEQNVLPGYFAVAQNDFAARLKWSVTPQFEDANHEPLVRVESTELHAAPGETVKLTGKISDPDNDTVTINWYQLRVGTYPGEVTITEKNHSETSVLIPVDAAPGQTIHVILEVTDSGTPALTRYQRVIITIGDAGKS